MSVSPVSNIAAVLPQAKPAADGDSPAVEAAESAATKRAETQGGGFAPKATESVTQNVVNKIV